MHQRQYPLQPLTYAEVEQSRNDALNVLKTRLDELLQSPPNTYTKEEMCTQLRQIGRLIKELLGACPEGMEECDGGCVPIGSCC